MCSWLIKKTQVEEEHNELGSPFLAPMRDSSGGYVHDAMGRVRKVSGQEAPDFKLVTEPMQARSPETSPVSDNRDPAAPKRNAGPSGGAGRNPTESVI